MGLAGCVSARWKPQSTGFGPLLQNRRRVSRPPSDIPDGGSDLGILELFVATAVKWSGIQFRHASLHA